MSLNPNLTSHILVYTLARTKKIHGRNCSIGIKFKLKKKINV